MSSLLHLDASIRTEGSISRELSSFFATEWRKKNPEADYTYRDLGAEPIPHITHAVRESLFDPSGDHGQTPEDEALSKAVNDELRDATTVILGVPMYNYTIPSSVKAWFDRLVHPGTMTALGADSGPLTGKKIVVASARGGSYAPGAPRAERDYQEPYLRAVLDSIGLAGDLTFVHAEMTFSLVIPAMAQLKPRGEKSLADAYEKLRELAAA